MRPDDDDKYNNAQRYCYGHKDTVMCF